MAGFIAFQPSVTQLISLTTVASVAVQPSTGGWQGMKIDNLSTNNVQMLISVTSNPSAAVLATTTGATAGFTLGANVKNLVVTTPPNAWVQALTTGAGLTAIVALNPGYGID
jgi:hypothetical protein